MGARCWYCGLMKPLAGAAGSPDNVRVVGGGGVCGVCAKKGQVLISVVHHYRLLSLT